MKRFNPNRNKSDKVARNRRVVTARGYMLRYLHSKGVNTKGIKQNKLIVKFAEIAGLKIQGNLKTWLVHICSTSKVLKGFGRKKVITQKDKDNYHDYLRSAKWKEFREKALDFYGNECGLCGSRYNLEVHHKTYINIFKEQLPDVMLLCQQCHYNHHFGGKKSA